MTLQALVSNSLIMISMMYCSYKEDALLGALDYIRDERAAVSADPERAETGAAGVKFDLPLPAGFRCGLHRAARSERHISPTKRGDSLSRLAIFLSDSKIRCGIEKSAKYSKSAAVGYCSSALRPSVRNLPGATPYRLRKHCVK